MFEFDCDRLIPGCDYKVQAETEEELHELAKDHLHEHHDVEYADDESWLIISRAVIPIIH
jgi:predicted small metal-binding protein